MSLSIKSVCAVLAAFGLLLGAGGCETIECGTGTLEIDGKCSIPDADTIPGGGGNPVTCGTGTILNPTTLSCDPVTSCGANTVPQQNPDGTIVCIGVGGGGGDCSAPMAFCTPPTDTGNDGTVCGVLRNTETNAIFRDTTMDPVLCDTSSPTADGPCAVQVRAFDPVAFANDPNNTPPLDAGGVFQDTCGRYSVTDIPVPFNGFVAVATSNVFVTGDEGPTVADTFRLSGVAFGMTPGERRTGFEGVVTRISTDRMWTDSAGQPFGDPDVDGQTFTDKGVYLPVFLNRTDGDPVSGVVITASGSEEPANDFYFSDAVATSRTTVDAAQNATGANGSGLLVNTTLRQHSGNGSEPSGCEWPTDLAVAIPNVVFFQNRPAHVIGDPMTTCPAAFSAAR